MTIIELECRLAWAEASLKHFDLGYAEHLFASSGPILLMSGHKSKGLEFDEVFHLDPWRIPSQYATEGEGYEQELNVEYVVRTRAKRRYTEITMEGFQS